MSCFDGYITLDKSTPSRSGLYANNLPGVTINLLDDLTTEDAEDLNETWTRVYDLAGQNFTSDVHAKLADKFHIDKKLASRETSEINVNVNNTNHGDAGIQYEYYRSKYAVNHCLTIEVYSNVAYASPSFEIRFYNAATGELLYTKDTSVSVGRNVIGIDQDLDADQIKVVYNATSFNLKQSDNKYYNSTRYIEFTKLACSYPCWGSSFNGAVYQLNGGGINAKFVSTCSVSRFICENMNIFKMAFYNRIAVDLMRERILSDRFNRFTTLSTDRAKELMDYYRAEYDQKLMDSIRNLKIQEDPICFECSSDVSATNLLP